jgi:hypothetical protein
MPAFSACSSAIPIPDHRITRGLVKWEKEGAPACLFQGPFPSAPPSNPCHFFLRNSQRNQKLVMSLRRAPLELLMPPLPGVLVHARCLQHLNPQLPINRRRRVPRSNPPQHPRQKPLLVFQSLNARRHFAHPLLHQLRPRFAPDDSTARISFNVRPASRKRQIRSNRRWSLSV